MSCDTNCKFSDSDVNILREKGFFVEHNLAKCINCPFYVEADTIEKIIETHNSHPHNCSTKPKHTNDRGIDEVGCFINNVNRSFGTNVTTLIKDFKKELQYSFLVQYNITCIACGSVLQLNDDNVQSVCNTHFIHCNAHKI